MTTTPQPPARRDPRTIGAIALVGLVAAVALGAFLVWLVFFSSAAPAAPTIESAAAQVSPSPAADAPGGRPASADGDWVIDRPAGVPLEGTGTFVGFRVDEVLSNIGETEAIGRTPNVSGSLRVAGSVLEEAVIEADLTAIRSDQSRREPAIQRALDTGTFPGASFRTSGPVDLGGVPLPGRTIEVTVPGVLAIRGVEQEVEATMQARFEGDVVVVVGSVPVDFTSFGVTMPRAPIVVSVEDAGELEWQLFFRRAG